MVDDAHWAEPTLLELLDYVADAARQPLLILCLARPDFTEKRPAYHQARPESVVRLEPLSPADSERLVSERLGHRTLLPDLRARVIETAQGNPLFIEQLLAATIHDHVWPELPPAIQALLAARSSDRLGPAERDLLRCASVLGAEFTVEALAALVPAEAARFIERHLSALEHKDLIQSSEQPSAQGRTFAFRHVLIQVAAYRSITHLARSELHRRVAAWLDAQPGTGLSLDELIASHLEQAFTHRRDAGLTDTTAEMMGLRARRATRKGRIACLRAVRHPRGREPSVPAPNASSPSARSAKRCCGDSPRRIPTWAAPTTRKRRSPSCSMPPVPRVTIVRLAPSTSSGLGSTSSSGPTHHSRRFAARQRLH